MAAGASAAVLPDDFSVEEALFALRQRLDDFSVAPDYTTAAAISLLLDSAADNIAGWSLEDESHVYEVAMIAQMMLRQVYRFLTSPSCNQIAVDSLSLGLPNSVAKLGVVCWDFSAARDIIQRFASKCSPRDNVLILCEALDKHSSIRVVNSSSYFIILVDGIGKVLPLIQRHRAHNIKIAMRAVIGCVKYTISVLDEHHGRNAIALFNAALVFSNTVQDMYKIMVDEEKEELTALLGLFALHNIACISQSKQDHILSACGPLAIGYSQLAIASGLSWLGLLTGDDIKLAIGKADEGLGMEKLDFFSLAMEGAHLAVSWMIKYCNKDQPSTHELQSALMEVNSRCTDKWRVVQMFMYLLRSRNYQWDVKSHSLEFLSHFNGSCNEPASQHTPLLSVRIATMMIKEIETIRISVHPDESIHTKAYAAIKKIIQMLPSSQRLGVLHNLFKDRACPISTGYLLDLVKDQIEREIDEGVMFNRSQDSEALPPYFEDCISVLHTNLGPLADDIDSLEKMLDCLSLLKFLLIRGSKMLPKPTLRRLLLCLLYPLGYYLAARNNDVYQVAFARTEVDECVKLADK